MKVYLEKQTVCWINGKEHKVNAGIQELDDNVAKLLIEAGYAKPVEDKKDDKVKK